MKGFTLIEVIVVAAIFIIILTIVINAVLLSNQIYWDGEKTTEIMQNGRVVMDAISREIRQSRRIVTSLPEDDYNSPSEIIFQDGHLKIISENEVAYGGSVDIIILGETASDVDGFYRDAFIKILNGPEEVSGEIRKIISYNGNLKEAKLEFPFSDSLEYFGLEYLVDTSYYYIHYYIDEDGFIWRKIFSHYFSGNSDTYVPFNAIPPDGETLETEILEEPMIVGEHFQQFNFWGSKLINISIVLNKNGKELKLFKKVFGRNL